MSELKLKIYGRNEKTGKRELVRVAESNTAYLPFGVVEDIIEAVDLESLKGSMDNKELLKKIGPAVMSSMKEIKPILLDTFDDLTEDELRYCNTTEIVGVIIDILTYAVKTMFSKNK